VDVVDLYARSGLQYDTDSSTRELAENLIRHFSD
jgi:hypothetical protein